MKNITFVFILLFMFSSFAFGQMNEINIIPQPKSLKRLQGEFELNSKTKIIAINSEERKLADFLNNLLMKNYGFKLEVSSKRLEKNYIKFYSLGIDPPYPPEESYHLNITENGIGIFALGAGRFYALQSLMQLLPVEFKGKTKIPAVDIVDEPRFKYRGMHLDVGRHFMPVEFVKKYIDLMSQYKFNYFHWHLTEDQGWRIEIKKYPKLKEIGSKRKESMLEKNFTPYKGDGIPVEGFYTQEQIKDVVAFAKARHITVIPEIELPGHSSAALAAYPELGCKENYDYKVQTTWGIFKEVYCPSEKTFQFLEDVVSEVVDLFPDSPYIHIGGDEVLKDFWKDSPVVNELKQKENLKDEHEVQSYFIRRMEKFINSKGKKIIGWDEILEGGTAPNATIMSWRGEKGGIESAKAKHDVIMTPNTFLYFDYGQGDPKYEPLNIGNYLPLEKVYSYNPEPQELTEDEKKYIIGAQANVWTEYLKTPQNVEYTAFPRMIALAEVVWSPNNLKNYADFLRRLQRHYQSLDKQNVNYRIPSPVGLQNILISETDKAKLELNVPISNGRIFYTLDGSEPTENSKIYEKPIELILQPNETVEVKTIVINAKGRKSVPYTAVVLRREKLKAVELKDKKSGVILKFYKGEFKSVKELDNISPTEKSESKSIQIPQFSKKTNELKDAFGAEFEGFIYAPEDAVYEFELESDDGASLQIGGENVVNSDGTHSVLKKTGLIPLSKGYHKIQIRYFQSGGDAVLNLRWGIKGTGLRRIYGNELFIQPMEAQ